MKKFLMIMKVIIKVLCKDIIYLQGKRIFKDANVVRLIVWKCTVNALVKELCAIKIVNALDVVIIHSVNKKYTKPNKWQIIEAQVHLKVLRLFFPQKNVHVKNLNAEKITVSALEAASNAHMSVNAYFVTMENLMIMRICLILECK